jgi:AcrR family transcriptional regulator
MVVTEKSVPDRRRTPRGQGRARLVGAATQLFAEQGVSGTSLQSIADRLGVTKAAVYHQFASKDEIVLAVAAPVIEQLRLIADTASALPEQQARASTIAGLVDLALDQRATAAVLRRDPTMAQILDGHQPYLEQLERIDALLLGPTPSAQRRIALAVVGGGIMAIGALPALDASTIEVRAGLVAAMTRALDTNDEKD